MLKNKFCIILLLISMMVPAFAEMPVSSLDLEPLDEQELVQDSDSINEKVIEDIELKQPQKEPEVLVGYKQPTQKRLIIKKFLAAMGGVLISSLLLFVLLSIYNKIRQNIITSSKEEQEVILETSKNLQEAIKTFLDKTKW